MRIRRIALPVACVLSLVLIGAAPQADLEGAGGGGAAGPASPALLPEHTAPARHPLADVGAIVEATIGGITDRYDDVTGPRTYFELSDTVVLAGPGAAPKQISQLGGLLPDGDRMDVFDLPELRLGSRYIFAVSSQPWVYTPIWSGLVFRVEGSCVVGPQDRVVTSLGVDGVRFGAPFDPQNDACLGALSRARFVTALVTATQQAGSTFAAPVNYEPSLSWRIGPTAQAAGSGR